VIDFSPRKPSITVSNLNCELYVRRFGLLIAFPFTALFYSLLAVSRNPRTLQPNSALPTLLKFPTISSGLLPN
jgi:hypothetical protein